MNKFQNRGIVLFMALATLLLVVVLTNVILNIMLSQSRLTQHQISRIQAYYAAQAGMNLAFDKLRRGNWTTGNYSLCSSGCTVDDSDILYRVNISIGEANSTTGIRQINLATNYTYTP